MDFPSELKLLVARKTPKSNFLTFYVLEEVIQVGAPVFMTFSRKVQLHYKLPPPFRSVFCEFSTSESLSCDIVEGESKKKKSW